MSSKAGKAAAGSSSGSTNKHRKPAKKVKPELSVDEQVRKKWKSLKDQVKEGYYENGLKTCTKILQLQPANDLAQRTYIQLLLNLDRYKEALAWITEDAERLEKWNIEQCYALYKLGREREADEVLQKSRDQAMDEDTTRTLDVLDAQIKYRLEQFSESQQLYEDLVSTVETDSPEYDDLSTNLSACNTHLEFLSSIPTRLGDLSSSSSTYKLPSVDVLESTPIAPLIAAHPAYKARLSASAAAANGISSTATGATASSSATPASTSSGKPAKKNAAKKLPTKLPPSIAALPEDKRPAPDPERWLPKRERKGYADVMAAKQKEKEKKRLKARKKMEATMTQGSSSSAPAESGKQQQSGNRPNNQQQQNKKKKKKGGK